MATSRDSNLSQERIQASLLAGPEKRILEWMAKRLPGWVTPDMLTWLGALAMAATGVCYLFSGRHRYLLLAASAGWVVNWFGDSMDGTVARVRNEQRPKYGYYLDHLVDAFGISFVLFGLAYSGLSTPPLCMGLLVLYLIMSINVYLATHTTGAFRISFARLSLTEGRIMFIALNTVLMFKDTVTVIGRDILIADIFAATLCLLLLALVVSSAAKNLRLLDREER